MSDDVHNDENIFQGEYIFPNLSSNSFCESKKRQLEKEASFYKMRSYIFLALFILFEILFLYFLINSTTSDTADFTIFTVICGIFSGFSVICCIVFLILMVRKARELNEVNFMIQVNNQYTEFITQGYTQKEAYKLTVEWIDRQSIIGATNRAANAANRIAAISMMNNINNN